MAVIELHPSAPQVDAAIIAKLKSIHVALLRSRRAAAITSPFCALMTWRALEMSW